MKKPLIINIHTLPKKVLQDMPPKRLSALLLLGLFFNEAIWLRRLLIQSTFAFRKSADPEPTLNLPALGSLVIFLGTILIGKIHEGKNKIINLDVKKVYGKESLPKNIENRKIEFLKKYDSAQCKDIRDKLTFHYNHYKNTGDEEIKKFIENRINNDLIYQPKFSQDQSIENTFITLSQFLSTDKLQEIMGKSTIEESLFTFVNNIDNLSVVYCQWCYEIIHHILSLIPNWAEMKLEEISIDSPAIDDFELYFFTHPPADPKFSEVAT